MPSQVFGWELFAEAYGEIFSDGFESGDAGAWSHVVGEIRQFDSDSTDDLAMSFRIDGSNWNRRQHKVVTLLSGVSDRRVPTFKVEARRRGHLFEVRVRAVSEANVWVESPWRPIDDRYGSIKVEWRRSLEETEDGLLYLSVDDELLMWLVDLDNDHLPLRQVHLSCLGGDPLAATIEGSFHLPGTSEVETAE
jgi:hypothetical protein